MYTLTQIYTGLSGLIIANTVATGTRYLGVMGTLTVPGAPTGVSAVAGNALATVSFTAPVNNGGETIDYYTASSSPGGITSATTSPTSVVVTGLSNGTPYTFTVYAHSVIGTSTASVATSPAVTPTNPCPATGGTPTSDATYCYNTYTTVGTDSFVVPSGSISADVLVVAGGGGGGGNTGGGGGGGGVLSLNLSISGSNDIGVGDGGAVNPPWYNGSNGGDSSFGTNIAYGGGGGGTDQGYGGNGGSGGGGGYWSVKGPGTGISGQGYDGGIGDPTFNAAGGGGGAGGLGQVGQVISGLACGGNGGEGFVSSISGSSHVYGSGGGGGGGAGNGTIFGNPAYGLGGTGGGNGGAGQGEGTGRNPSAATYYGGGGGGAAWAGSGLDPWSGQVGYQGIVIVRYLKQ